MKPGSTPTPPNDEGSDPLLAALRQRLGDYGQAPPPAAWAAIRQRLPQAPVRPWWRRPRRILPLLVLLLVSLGLLTGQQDRPWLSAQLPGSSSPASQAKPSRPLGKLGRGSTAGPGASSRPVAAAAPRASKDLITNAPHTGQRRKASELSAHHEVAGPVITTSFKTTINAASGAAASRKPTSSAQHSTAKRKRPRPTLALATAPGRRHRNHAAFIAAPIEHQPVISNKQPGIRPAKRHSSPTSLAATSRSVGTPPMAADLTAAAAVPLAATPPARRARARWPGATTAAANQLAAARPYLLPAGAAARPRPALAAPQAAGAIDSLRGRQPVLGLAAPALPSLLRARADSALPARPLARRWALLVLAGPTLSYRTLGLAPLLAAGQPDFARLERPALGLGAQVQLRRVLSGRWALSVGVGYHAYATQLALSLKDSTGYTTVHQRDTYRLLTLPVQLSYALGAARGRLATALLLGTEPGWYLGGRSTEGSGCGCEQQPYSSAASSPYRSLSLAFSLGLDLRYRLGSADSRWQWLVQPTGRYVATPFVRSDAVGFTRRQPFSLGLLTGFSWDVR